MNIIIKPLLILPEGMTFEAFKKLYEETHYTEKDDIFEILLHKTGEKSDYWHCPYCGWQLEEVPEENEDWGTFCGHYRKQHGTEHYLCSNLECTFNKMPLVLCHPVYGWDKPAGDSFALAWVK